MPFLRIIVAIFCLHISTVFANTVDCEPSEQSGYIQWEALHTPMELRTDVIGITLSHNIPDWSILYSVELNVGDMNPDCSEEANMYYTLFGNNPVVGQQGLDVIYSTNIPGIGVSVESPNRTDSSVPVYPSVLYFSPASGAYGFLAIVKYWKIPGEIPTNIGALTVTGPEASIVLMLPGYSMTSSDPERITGDGLAYIATSKILTLTMMFQPGTCNIEGDNITVKMGDYDGENGHSEWKDASFKLDCPDGMGYGGRAASGSIDYPNNLSPEAYVAYDNNTHNGPVQISIVPYTDVIDANKGIIALDGTGAQGYGIQLAWGDYSTQDASEPANPVFFNSFIDAHSLNAAFSGDLTPFGGNGFTGDDNTIKMAAR